MSLEHSPGRGGDLSGRDDDPPYGWMLQRLGYLTEAEQAHALGIRLQTLIEYRKLRIGPEHTEVARVIYYGPKAGPAWLESGGTRGQEK